MPYVGWVCRWFSPLLWEVFLCVLRFSPLLKKPTLPNSNSIWNILTYFNEFSRTPKCFKGKQITLFFITILQFTIWSWKFNISQKFIWVQSDFCAYNLPKKVNLWSFGICYLEKLDVKQSLGYLENMALDWSTLWEDI